MLHIFPNIYFSGIYFIHLLKMIQIDYCNFFHQFPAKFPEVAKVVER